MNEILIQAFVEAIKNERMTIEQVPIPYKEAVDHFVNAYGTYKPDDEARLEEMD